jgi:hypothetical protein
MCFGYNSCMVALTKKSANFPQRPIRVRAKNHRYRLGAERCSKSNSRANLRRPTYDECDQLGSCSKDPIGYIDGLNYYSTYIGLRAVDPSGFICQPVDPEEPDEPRGPCGDTKVDPAVIPTIELCKTMFKIAAVPIKNPGDLCNLCKKIPGGRNNPLKKLCDEACKKAKDYAGDKLIEFACCSGLTNAPAAPCLEKLYDDGPIPDNDDVLQCTVCCDKLKELQGNPSAISLCKKACNANSQGF